ncbi:MAG: SDR family oxidoreductase [Acetobacter sp.]|nr:SDR family oxidoreductase [Acetobacter sp.]
MLAETFSGQVAFVTTSEAEMKLADTQAFAHNGPSLVLADVDFETATMAADGLIEEGVQAFPLHCDLAIDNDGKAAIGEAVYDFGQFDFAPKDIRINAVCRSVIDTLMLHDLPHGDGTVKAEWVKPGEIASTALCLRSPGSSFMLGHPLAIDVGYSAQ